MTGQWRIPMWHTIKYHEFVYQQKWEIMTFVTHMAGNEYVEFNNLFSSKILTKLK